MIKAQPRFILHAKQAHVAPFLVTQWASLRFTTSEVLKLKSQTIQNPKSNNKKPKNMLQSIYASMQWETRNQDEHKPKKVITLKTKTKPKKLKIPKS